MVAVPNVTFIQITVFSAVINQRAVTGRHFYILQLVGFVSEQHYTAADL